MPPMPQLRLPGPSFSRPILVEILIDGPEEWMCQEESENVATVEIDVGRCADGAMNGRVSRRVEKGS